MILGTDAYLGLPRWHRWRELLSLAHLLVVARPGYAIEPAGELAEFDLAHRAELAALTEQPAGAVVHVQPRLLDISATEVRHLTAAGRSTQYLLPDAVRHYISEHGLYQADAHSL